MGEAAENTAKSRPAQKPADPTVRSRAMGKETKIGLGVIGLLLVVFAIVLVVRLRNNDPARQPGGVADLLEDDEVSADEHEPDVQGVSGRPSLTRTAQKQHTDQGAPKRNASRRADAWAARKTPGGTATASRDRLGSESSKSSGQHQRSRRTQPVRDVWDTDGHSDEEPFDPTDDAWAGKEADDHASAADDSDEQFDPDAGDGAYTVAARASSAQRGSTYSGQRPASSPTAKRAGPPVPSAHDVMPGDDEEDDDAGESYADEQEPAQASAPAVGSRFRPAAASRGAPQAMPSQNSGFDSPARAQRLQDAPGTASPADEQPPAAFPQDDTYTVQPNDNYWTISRSVYGTGAYFKALYEHNRDRYPYPDQLRAGDVIETPPAAALEQTYPDLCPQPRHSRRGGRLASVRPRPGSRTYIVREGDTLFDIARAELGRASRWAELYELNRDVLGDDFDYLTPGMELLLPADQPAAETEEGSDSVTTQRPRRPYRR